MRRETKEQIKNRMLKKAADLWNVPLNEINDSFDPLITLLIAACASEIEKLSGQIDDSQTRITERLIQVLTPETIYDSKPSHAIAYAESIEPHTFINEEYSLYYKKKVSGKNASHSFKNLFFSPVQNTKLVDAKVRYMIAGNKVFNFSNGRSKELMHVFKNGQILQNSTIYLGIESDLEHLTLNDVSFYFEYLGVDNMELFYHHLKNAHWFFENNEIEVMDGFFNSNDVDTINLKTIFGGEPTKTNNISNQVKEFYRKHFITIKSLNKLHTIGELIEIEELSKKEKLKFSEQTRWIKIVFPSVIKNESLEKLFCSLNAFPVLNRKKEKLSYHMKNLIDVVPIISEELFLDIKKIVNIKGDSYQLDTINKNELDKGIYFLRNSNVGKLDSRKAKEYINHLLELLKDESAAFSFYNREFLESSINTLNQTISLLESKISEVSEDTVYTNYLYLKPYTKSEQLLIEYWTTNGSEANHIKPGSKLEIYEGIDLKQKNSYLVTPTFGGSDYLSMEQRLNAYRRISLTRNRVITQEDIKALCYELYDDKISDVLVKKGFVKENGLKKGLVQCIEIVITPKEKENIHDYEWEYMSQNVLSTLKKQSVNIFPFKISIDKKKKVSVN